MASYLRENDTVEAALAGIGWRRQDGPGRPGVAMRRPR
jgi:hypothetical protein